MSDYTTIKLDKHIFSQEGIEGEVFFNEVASRGGMIAGGYLRSLFDGRGYGDIDIFTPNQRVYEDITGYMNAGLNTWAPIRTKYSDHYSIGGLCKQTKDFAIMNSGSFIFKTQYKINIINPIKGEATPEALLDRFDFTCVKACAVSGQELIIHKDFIEHTTKKELHYNSEVNDLLMYRILKYKDYGYSCKLNALDILKWAYKQLTPNKLSRKILGTAVSSFPFFRHTLADLYEKWLEKADLSKIDNSMDEVR
jgi:hypothetical protein